MARDLELQRAEDGAGAAPDGGPAPGGRRGVFHEAGEGAAVGGAAREGARYDVEVPTASADSWASRASRGALFLVAAVLWVFGAACGVLGLAGKFWVPAVEGALKITVLLISYRRCHTTADKVTTNYLDG